ncbi:nitrate reductase subunit alpha [Hyphomicrobium zavarzinii]|uniref:nitrate reductase subunit alpha n=1 Tax=Hyphomicrobium zavarzinii TaxID=48292 RepID=UPI000369D1F8|nr:nitrate reductase subunit alpha [Hyphomicrobium zavarzinii]
MSYLFDKLSHFHKKPQPFADGHGALTEESRKWEQAYRQRWQHDKIVRSTHGVNCTGSCSWKIYVKNGLVTWETQQTDYPRTRADLPNHEPRGCARGASYSWYIYSANRLKYPLVRRALWERWLAIREMQPDPVLAWADLQAKPQERRAYQLARGHGGFIRATWEGVNELIAAANIYTAKKWGPDRVVGFSPIPAMSMVSYAAGARYLSLLGGVCMSFYDWYCDLPPSSPQTWGEQTDVPESADWFNAGLLMMWGSNVPQTRTPDAHFLTEARYKGTTTIAVCPDFSEASKLADVWMAPKQGTDAALAMAMGHVILKERYVDKQEPYFQNYARDYTDMPLLVMLEERNGKLTAGRFLRAADLPGNAGETNNPDWKTLAFSESGKELVVPKGSIGFRWGEEGQWHLKPQKGKAPVLRLTLLDKRDEVATVAFPYFGSRAHEHFNGTDHAEILLRKVPAKKLKLKKGHALVATVHDLMLAHYGVDRGLGDASAAENFDDNQPYTPAWQQAITGVEPDLVTRVARAFADNSAKTNGRSTIIIGAAMNHWYHMDMNYRAIINLLVMCGCVGQPGGGWAHYVGQEKLRPQTGWAPLAFGADWYRPARQVNSTSFWYAHTDQWRYEKLDLKDMLSPLADPKQWGGSFIDCNIRAESMGWLPSAPQLATNSLSLLKAMPAGETDVAKWLAKSLSEGDVELSCMDPDAERNWPRNLFVWRSNLLGSSGKGHEYFLKHLLGTRHGVLGEDMGAEGKRRNKLAAWHEKAPEGKLDLLVALDFRMSTTCVYSDIVLPTASWYEKHDLNTSDMHPFIHPLSAAIDPVWESRTDYAIFKGFAENVSRLCDGHLGEEKDVVLTPILHDTPGELAQPYGVSEWLDGKTAPVPGRTMANVAVVTRDYRKLYERFTTIGPLLEKVGNGGKGMSWNTTLEMDQLRALNGKAANGQPSMKSDVEFCEAILQLAPETNGEVAVKAWASLEKATGRHHTHLAEGRHHEKHRFRDLQAQPRKIISSPIWSGIEDENVTYNAGYTNVHEFIPWRTLTGRQQLYQDHAWLRDFGEGLVCYKPPVDLQAVKPVLEKVEGGNPALVLNFLTPHQKWGIHSTYSDNLLMLTLSRGGPIVWLSEVDAAKAGIADNDWIEALNVNGSLVARAVVSQRVPEGMTMMYHAQEKIVNTPGSPTTGLRGGIHNSVTRVVLKPTHMVGGCAQLSYGFNYYGTVGCNRDEFVVVRRLDKVDWLEGPDTHGHSPESNRRVA